MPELPALVFGNLTSPPPRYAALRAPVRLSLTKLGTATLSRDDLTYP